MATDPLLRFRGEQPHRRIALVWRKSSAMGEFLKRLADVVAG